MPTRTGIATAVSAVICLTAGRIFGIFELYIVAAAMLALVVCAVVWVLLNWRSLHVARAVSPSRLHAGGSSTVTLDLANHRMIPTPVARITDEVEGTVRADANVPPIRRHGTTRASYRVPTERRGRIEIGPMKTKVTDPFGLAASTRTTAPDTHLLVLPKVDRIVAPPQPGGQSAHELDRTPNRVGANGDDFSSLRAYAIGDDLRKVHWPSSARSGELVVRTEHVPEHGHSLVVLDVRAVAADAETFELMVSAAASVMVACSNRGDRVRFVTTAGFDAIGDSPASFDAILDALALIEQSSGATASLPFRLGRNGAEAGAMIVARDAETMIATMPSNPGGMSNTFVVRFVPEGAKTQLASIGLPSGRMIDVHPTDDFADSWNSIVGLAARNRR